jgi:hypothetical protein
MTDRTSSRLRRAAPVALVGVLAAAGWLAGAATRDRPASAAALPAAGPAAGPAVAARAASPRPDLPSLAPAGAAVAAADLLHPRPAHEWQGMRVDLSQRQYCEASSYCGFALACLDDQRCGPCQRDDQCAAGEVCVLDHCVKAANAGCRTRAECGGTGDDAMCVLSGLTGGEPRGNAEMRSFCRSSSGGTPQDESAPDPRRAARLAAAAAQQPVAPPVSAQDLRARLATELDARAPAATGR